jgi:hypothetical protein
MGSSSVSVTMSVWVFTPVICATLPIGRTRSTTTTDLSASARAIWLATFRHTEVVPTPPLALTNGISVPAPLGLAVMHDFRQRRARHQRSSTSTASACLTT